MANYVSVRKRIHPSPWWVQWCPYTKIRVQLAPSFGSNEAAYHVSFGLGRVTTGA